CARRDYYGSWFAYW
nr:immunoglobulin heavy chain junction region [Mus musculus]